MDWAMSVGSVILNMQDRPPIIGDIDCSSVLHRAHKVSSNVGEVIGAKRKQIHWMLKNTITILIQQYDYMRPRSHMQCSVTDPHATPAIPRS